MKKENQMKSKNVYHIEFKRNGNLEVKYEVTNNDFYDILFIANKFAKGI